MEICLHSKNRLMLYQLGKYNTKDDLSIQAKRVRNHIQVNWDFNSIHEIIKEYENLEFETVLILNKAINAGYWNSIYGLHWSNDDELKFWTTVYSKSKELTISKLQLLRTYQSSGSKKAHELIEEYVDILNKSPELYYELINEDLDGIWKVNPKLKVSCLNAMFIHLAADMKIDEFTEEVDSQLMRHYPDKSIPQLILDEVNRIKKSNSR